MPSPKALLVRKHSLSERFARDKWYLLFTLPAVILLMLFSYFPMYGLSIAFQDYRIGDPLISFTGATRWVGLQNFINFFQSHFFGRVFTNTLRLSLKTLLWGAWVSPLVALLLNEVRVMWFKRTVQTCYYLPYFVSIAIVVSIMSLLTSSAGPISKLSVMFGGKAVNYMNDPNAFDALYVISEIWRGFGYSAIMYLASIASVDPNLYEAVEIDGGNRLHKVRHVTLPHILPTMMILLILQIGGMLGASSEKVLLMYNASTMDKADIIGTYVYRVGLRDAKYSYTTAVGLFANIINFMLVFGANFASRKITGTSLW